MKKKQQTSLSSFFGAAASSKSKSKSNSSKSTEKSKSALVSASASSNGNGSGNSSNSKDSKAVQKKVDANVNVNVNADKDKDEDKAANVKVEVHNDDDDDDGVDDAPLPLPVPQASKSSTSRSKSDYDDDGLMDTTDEEGDDDNDGTNDETNKRSKNRNNKDKVKAKDTKKVVRKNKIIQNGAVKTEISNITGKPIRSKKNRANHHKRDNMKMSNSSNINDNENDNDNEQDVQRKAKRTKTSNSNNSNNNSNDNDEEDDDNDIQHVMSDGYETVDMDDADEAMEEDELDDIDEDDIDEDHFDEDDYDDEDNDDEDNDDEENATIKSLHKSKSSTKSRSNTNTNTNTRSTKKTAFDLMKQQQKQKQKQSSAATSSSSKGSSSTSKKSNTKSSSSSSSTTSSTKPNTKHYDENWKPNTPIPYSTFTQTLSKIEAITSRLEIQSHLTSLFTQTIHKHPSDLINIVYLASNTVAPAYKCVELGIGDAILIKAVSEASGSTTNIIKAKYDTQGDLGTVALHAKSKQRTLGLGFGRLPKPLMAVEVLDVYRQIAAIVGSQSRNQKVGLIKGLLVRATAKGDEAKYIIRGLQGKLRIGLAQSTVLISLAHAILTSCSFDNDNDGDNDGNQEDEEEQLSIDCQNVKNTKTAIEIRLESAVNIVKKAYSEVSSFDALVEALISVPLHKLHKKCTLRPGNPVTPMLAKPTKSIQEVLKRLDGKRFTCEYKYDGERAQVHMQGDGVTKVFSRSLLDTSEKYPEVPLYVKEACVKDKVTSFILDTEVVAYNRETKQFVPFQILSTRKKTEESTDNAKVKVIVQAFDLMYLNGQSLLDRTLAERRALLLENFKVVDGKFQFAKSLDHKEDGDTAIIEDFLEAAVKGQCEGLMVKTLDENASYQPSKRSLNWLKLKKDYLDSMGDSVDLVPIGAYHGKGKRTGVYGAYLLACYDVDTEEYQSVCKIGTGFSDEDLKTLSSGLQGSIISEKSAQYNVSSSLECDVWFDTCQVWEVRAADLSKSPAHTGAIDKTGESGRGIGLRFPRFERLRDDKKPENATTSDQILEMYYAQDSIVDDGVGDDDDDGI